MRVVPSCFHIQNIYSDTTYFRCSGTPKRFLVLSVLGVQKIVYFTLSGDGMQLCKDCVFDPCLLLCNQNEIICKRKKKKRLLKNNKHFYILHQCFYSDETFTIKVQLQWAPLKFSVDNAGNKITYWGYLPMSRLGYCIAKAERIVNDEALYAVEQ